ADRLWLCHGDGRMLGSWRGGAGPAPPGESTPRDPDPRGGAGPAGGVGPPGVGAAHPPRRGWGGARVGGGPPPGRPAAGRGVHAAGLLAFGWDAQSPQDIERGLELGLDGLYSDHVDRLMAAINHGRRS